MNQINLFRATDPESSQRAAEELTSSGRHDFQKGLCFSFLGKHPNCTSMELAHQMADHSYMHDGVLGRRIPKEWRYYYDILHKRLPDLRRAGKAKNGELRKCRISGRLAQTWIASAS